MTDHALTSTPTDHTSQKIAIIGGGLTGLLTATLLERSFSDQSSQSSQVNTLDITIFEKSRSVGRLATRYRTDSVSQKNWQWAFGAQFFTAKTTGFQQFIAPWRQSGLLQPWCANVVELTPAHEHNQPPVIRSKEQWDTDHARYISTPKMTSWGRELAAALKDTTIVFKTRVAPLAQYAQLQAQDGQKTELFDEVGTSLGWFDWVICTAPNGQAVELMADSGFSQQDKIMQPQMQACYTLMLGWDDSQKLPETVDNRTTEQWDVAYLNSSVLDRVFIEHQKPAHHQLLPSITIHARNDWSEKHVDDDMNAIKVELLQAAQQALNWSEDNAPSQIDCHRWRFAATIIDTDTANPVTDSVDTEKERGILLDAKKQWIVSGDWCDKGNIESCYHVAKQTLSAIEQAR